MTMDMISTILVILRGFGMRIVIAAMVAVAAAAPARAAGTGAAFLKNNLDVRSEAMGGGAQALVTGAAAAFKNPAGLARAQSSEMLFSYSQGLLGSSFQGVSYVHAGGSESVDEYRVSPSGIRNVGQATRARTTFGAHAIYHEVGAIETTDANFNGTGQVRPYNVEAGVTMARNFRGASAGLSLKAIHQSLGVAEANSYAADLGVMLPTGFRGLSLAGSITNLGTPVRFAQESFSLPTASNIGLGYQTHFLRFVADVQSPMRGDGHSRLTFGTEFVPLNVLALRLGYLNQLGGLDAGSGSGGSSGLGFGAGLMFGRYSLDYAIVPTAFEATNKISLKMAF